MSPRRYHAPRRRAASEETRRRIVDAVIELHAEQGVTRTTYAQIAERADVAVPTVYNHFPKIGDLLAACGGGVLAGAPPLGPEIFAGADDLDSRFEVLARALSAFYRYAAPWLRWTVHESVLVRELADRYRGLAEGRRKLLDLALAPAFGRRAPAPLVALCEILLDFPAWQRLARDEKTGGETVETALARGLLALAREHMREAEQTRSGDRITSRRGRRT